MSHPHSAPSAGRAAGLESQAVQWGGRAEPSTAPGFEQQLAPTNHSHLLGGQDLAQLLPEVDKAIVEQGHAPGLHEVAGGEEEVQLAGNPLITTNKVFTCFCALINYSSGPSAIVCS